MLNLKSLRLFSSSLVNRLSSKCTVLKVDLLYIGPENIPFAGVCVCTFLPGCFTSWSSEGVNLELFGHWKGRGWFAGQMT